MQRESENVPKRHLRDAICFKSVRLVYANHLMTKQLLALFVSASFIVTASAQDVFVPDKGQGEIAKPNVQEPTKEEKELQDKIKKYEETIKDAVKITGAFTFYQKKKDIFLELTPEQFGKYWMLQGAFRTGATADVTPGMPIGRDFQAIDAFRFERRDDDVWLMVPNIGWRWEDTSPWAIAAKRAFPEAVLDSYRIEAENPTTKRILIKLNDLFFGDIFELQPNLTMALGRPYMLDRNKSRVSEIKGFPENNVIRMDLYYSSPRGGGAMPAGLAALLGLSGKSQLADDRSLPIQVTYLMYPRKQSDYIPRFADPRVGYFTQDFYDHAKFGSMDRTSRFITRWNVQKTDAKAVTSKAKNPIVWYLDDSVPEKWRPALREGILRWNGAFELIGIKDAIQVLDKPKNADWDHADMRYNVVRFFASENAGYAIALFRTDPFTGEILNASINIDANIVMYLGQEYTWMSNPARGNPWGDSIGRMTSKTVPAPFAEPTTGLMSSHFESACKMGELKLENAVFGRLALDVLSGAAVKNVDDYINQFLADVVSHEFGHCLGLRHNFVASAQLSLKQLADVKITAKKGNSSSVMDYVPVNIAAVSKGSGSYYSLNIGDYDRFAIEYGYKDVIGKDPIEERSHLMQIASRGSLPGLGYMSDEQADQFDPFVRRFDFSKDPLDAVALTCKVTKELLSKADSRYPKKGRPYSDLSQVVLRTLNMVGRQSANAAFFVGGIQGRRNFAGDPGEKPTLMPIDPNLQRAAMNLIARELLQEDSFKFSAKQLMNLSGDMNEQYDSMPIKDMISGVQIGIASLLLSADITERVANNAFKLGNNPNRFTISELYGKIVVAVYSEVGTGREIGPLRRDLQRFLISGLISQALAAPGQVQEDVRMVAYDTLRRLSIRFGSAIAANDMTAMHLRDSKMRIDRALKSIMATPR